MSIQNPDDHALKILARTYPAEFLRLGFPDKSVRLLGALAAEIEAARREAEITQQWQELMFKVLGHRFTSAPLALVLLLQAVKPAQRSQVSDIILDSPDVDACLQALRQLQIEACE